MFTELKTLLGTRSLTITVAAIREAHIRVNVVPHARPEDAKANEQIKYSHKEEVAGIPDAAVKALTTPLSLTGTPEEIDANLPGILLKFVDSHTQLQATFDRASSEISAAVKAIDERNKEKNKNKPKSGAAPRTEQTEDTKAKSEESNTNPDGTLPLWSAQGTAAACGHSTPQENSSPTSAPNRTAGQPISQSSSLQEAPNHVDNRLNP